MTEQTQSTDQPQAQAAELTVTDLSAIKQIIDVASSRGAFKPNEMAVVGNTYTKLDAFLSAVQSQANSGDAENSKAKEGE